MMGDGCFGGGGDGYRLKCGVSGALVGKMGIVYGYLLKYS